MLPNQPHQYLRPPARTQIRPRQVARSQPAQPTQVSSTSSSPPQADNLRPPYPISIPPEKLTQAVELYRKYLLADLVAGGSQPGGPSSPSKARSATGKSTISQAETAISVSTNGELVNFGVMDIGDQSAGALTTFDGKKVKVKRRSALSPKARAKAELIRFLGACKSCHARRVQCPLDHHDIAHLKEVYQKQSSGSPSRSQHQGSQSSNTSCNSSGTLAPESQPMNGNSQGLSDTLLGIGDNLQYTITDTSMSELDSQPTIAETSQRISVRTAEIERPGPLFEEFPSPFQPHEYNPYGAVMDGEDIWIGVFCHVVDESGRGRGFYKCEYLGCDSCFVATDELQDHFAQEHFEYSRRDPAHAYICAHCHVRMPQQTNLREANCASCGQKGSKLWIVGSFIGNPFYQPDAPDFQPVGKMSAYGSDTKSYTSSDSGEAPFQPAEPSFNENQNFGNGNGNNYGGLGYGHHDAPAYPEPSAGNYQYGNLPYGSQFPRNQFMQGQRAESDDQFNSPRNRGKPAGKMSFRRKMAFLVAFLLLVLVGPSSFDWFVLKGLSHIPYPISQPSQPSQEHFPAFGFMSLLFSAAAFWTIRHITTCRARRRREKYSKSLCPRYSLPLFTSASKVQCTMTTTYIYPRGTEHGF